MDSILCWNGGTGTVSCVEHHPRPSADGPISPYSGHDKTLTRYNHLVHWMFTTSHALPALIAYIQTTTHHHHNCMAAHMSIREGKTGGKGDGTASIDRNIRADKEVLSDPASLSRVANAEATGACGAHPAGAGPSAFSAGLAWVPGWAG